MDRRKQLLAAAEEVFREKGFRGATLREIGERAGMSASLISYYFNNKEALYREIYPEEPAPQPEGDVRSRIAAAALRLFAAEGYDRVSIRDIAREACVNSAAISYYFGGKAGLYRDVLYRGTEEISEFIRIVEGKQPPPEEIFRIYGRFLVRLGREKPAVLRLIFGELIRGSEVFHDFVRQRFSQVTEVLHGAVARGAEAGVFRKDVEPEDVCVGWQGMLLFYFLSFGAQRVLFPERQPDGAEYMRKMWSVFMKGLEAEEPRDGGTEK